MSLLFNEYIAKRPAERLQYFLNTLAATNRAPDYYVNWQKVVTNAKKYELSLNTLNYLIGKENIYEETIKLFSTQPNLIEAIPALIAIREKAIDILSLDEEDNMNFYKLNFQNISIERIIDYVNFCKETGLLHFLSKTANRSLVDYLYGVVVGLDSNGRKNRSGTTMENILERQVSKICNILSYEHSSQATPKYIEQNWCIKVPVDKSARRFDETIYSPKNKHLWIIETNYYGGGGSKLKAVAGEFTTLSRFITSSKNKITFVWITDGMGWHTAELPLAEAFDHINYIFNLKMLHNNYLTELLKIH